MFKRQIGVLGSLNLIEKLFLNLYFIVNLIVRIYYWEELCFKVSFNYFELNL